MDDFFVLEFVHSFFRLMDRINNMVILTSYKINKIPIQISETISKTLFPKIGNGKQSEYKFAKTNLKIVEIV